MKHHNGRVLLLKMTPTQKKELLNKKHQKLLQRTTLFQ